MTPFLFLFLSFSLPLTRKDKAPLCNPPYIAKERNLSAECIIRISSPSITIRFTSTQYNSSTHSKTNLLTQGYDEGKRSIYCRYQARSPGKLKSPKFHDDFQGNGLKHRVRERVRDVWSAHGCLLIGWWWGNQQPISSSFWVLWPCEHHAVNIFHTVGISISVKQHQEFGSDTAYSSWGGTKGPWCCLMVNLLLLCFA